MKKEYSLLQNWAKCFIIVARGLTGSASYATMVAVGKITEEGDIMNYTLHEVNTAWSKYVVKNKRGNIMADLSINGVIHISGVDYLPDEEVQDIISLLTYPHETLYNKEGF